MKYLFLSEKQTEVSNGDPKSFTFANNQEMQLNKSLFFRITEIDTVFINTNAYEIQVKNEINASFLIVLPCCCWLLKNVTNS